jgi:hypothetical protein
MFQNTTNSLHQSSNILTLSVFTTWRTIYLINWNIRKHPNLIFNHVYTEVVHMAWLRAHLMLQCHLAMPSQQSLAAIAQSGSHILAKIPPHVLKHPKMFVPQSLIMFTPKWSTQLGKNFTSCFKLFVVLIHNLQTCLHKVLSQPGEQSTSNIGTFENIPQSSSTILTPKWSTWSGFEFTSCFNVISRCHIGNLRLRLHNVGHTFWWKSSLMCWDIRKCLAHNLQSCLHRSVPHNLGKKSPHASKYPRFSSAIFKHAYTNVPTI